MVIPVERAREIIDEAVGEITLDPPIERVGFREAIGRVLAEGIVAPFSLPRFTNSAMDGFAVRSADVAPASDAAPVTLRLIDTIPAGAAAERTVGPGEAIAVMTGGVIPDGADAVVPVESTSGFDATPLVVRSAVEARRNIRFEGEEVRADDTVIPAGTVVHPGELGVIASLGHAEVAVRRRPRVVIFATGDELREPGESLAPGQIYNSNLHVLRELSRLAGAEVVACDILRDDRDALESFLRDGTRRADVVISSGGVSMGKFDYVHQTLRDVGMHERFWRVAQKPAKPLYFASGDGTLFFGLPGNPVSVTVGFIEYAWPALARLGHRAAPVRRRLPLAAPLPGDPGKTRFLFGTIERGADGIERVAPTGRLGSHMLTAALGADCLIEAPPLTQTASPSLPVGREVTARILPWSSGGEEISE